MRLGVRVATRRFANKEHPISANRDQRHHELEAILQRLDAQDRWAGLSFYLERSLAVQARGDESCSLLSGGKVRPE
ncbi:hypothetical protein EFL26_20370 [Nocardioides pocheonensis]|uniref:Uncharacterized protein n=1 Tax=Nocardioides pocheonensis TaxID=661485 RepID=A0A3N0GI54_9ACTN|nr:hypothetical protein EFL26_20370 [Nocardioides pocheonensis]